MEIPATDPRQRNVVAFGHLGVPIYDETPTTYRGADVIAVRSGTPPSVVYTYYKWDGAAFVELQNAVTLAADADTLLGLTGQQLTLDTQLANRVFAGPASGGAADPTFRALVDADMPANVILTSTLNWIDLTDGGVTALHSHGGGGGGHTIRENGTDQTARTGLNFIDTDAGVGLITDDAGGNETEVNLGLYVLQSVGRSGGTTIFGGQAANENLLLGGTSHATHTTSIISMLDHVRMAAGKVIQDSGGNTRITLSTSAPELLLTGGVKITGAMGLVGTTVSATSALTISPSVVTWTTLLTISPQVTAVVTDMYMINMVPNISGDTAVSQLTLIGVRGVATLKPDGATVDHALYGLQFAAIAHGSQLANSETITFADVYGAYTNPTLSNVQVVGSNRNLTVTQGWGVACAPTLTFTGAAATGGMTRYMGLASKKATAGGAKITDWYGIWSENETTPTGTINLLEIGGDLPIGGSANPYFRVKGNFTAAANVTPIYISEGATPTLRQLKTIVETGLNIATGTKLICYLA